MATPGGDLNEFLIACAIYEGLTNKVLAQTDVDRFFRIYLKNTVKISFYYSSDRKAVENLGKLLRIERLDLTDSPPNQDMKNSLLKELTLPDNIGSEHFRKLMKKPDKYNTRKGLTEMVIRAFFKTIWDKAQVPPIQKKLRFVVLEGQNLEKAFVKIQTTADCANTGIAPLIAPKTSDSSMYVVHPQAVAVMRQELSNFFADQDPKVDSARFMDNMNELGNRHLEKDMEYLARSAEKKIPVWNVNII